MDETRQFKQQEILSTLEIKKKCVCEKTITTRLYGTKNDRSLEKSGSDVTTTHQRVWQQPETA